MRLFVALDLPAAVRRRLAGLQSGIPGARWVPEANLHLTLRFIGEIDRHRAEDIADALADIRAPAFTFDLAGIGQFGQGRHQRSLYAAVADCPPLHHLAAKIDSAVLRAGGPAETRKFTPHVTVARLGRDAPAERLARFIEGNGLFFHPGIIVEHFTLFESLTGNEAAHYDILAEFPLEGGAGD